MTTLMIDTLLIFYIAADTNPFDTTHLEQYVFYVNIFDRKMWNFFMV